MPLPIVIIGSSNTDMVIRADHIPLPGETVLGGSFFMNPGGKGANQAIAAARLGGDVIFICKTGDDIFGRIARESFGFEGIQTHFSVIDNQNPSGIALIMVDRHGENCIMVAPGANNALIPLDLEPAKQVIEQAGIVLLQLEIPLETVEYVVATANKKGKVILNPAPACEIPNKILNKVNIITPNEIEAEKLTGIKVENRTTAEKAARALQDKGVEIVIITLGADGALLLNGNSITHIQGYKVDAIDTTGAGDIFNGALAEALSEGNAVEDSVRFACQAAAISVTRQGAQSSAPFRHEIQTQN